MKLHLLIGLSLFVVACGASDPGPAVAPANGSGGASATTAAGSSTATRTDNTPAGATTSSGASSDGPSGGGVPDAEKQIAAMRPDFKACYNEGLKKDPKMEGLVMVEAKIGPAGDVLSVSPTSDTQGLSSDVIDCISKRIKAGMFAPPGDKGATLRVPVRFKAAKAPAPAVGTGAAGTGEPGRHD